MAEEREKFGRIVIPDVDSYRAGILVLREPRIGRDIINPLYDNSVMTGRVLKPVLETGFEVD
jgi:hypothetical protein